MFMFVRNFVNMHIRVCTMYRDILICQFLSRWSGFQMICSEGLFPTQENDVLKQIQEFFSTLGLPACPYPDSHPPNTKMAIFVKSHLKK